jgi:hydrogenase expression/formation protein HypC
LCIAVPMRIVALDGLTAEAEMDGVRREVRLDVVSGVQVGDYVLVHAGLAIARVDLKVAEDTLALWRRLSNEDN